MRLGARAGVFVAVAMAAATTADPAAGQEGRREVEAGNRLYEEGRFQEAHARYMEALQKVPGLPVARFNEGSALYQSQEFQRAMEAFPRGGRGSGSGVAGRRPVQPRERADPAAAARAGGRGLQAGAASGPRRPGCEAQPRAGVAAAGTTAATAAGWRWSGGRRPEPGPAAGREPAAAPGATRRANRRNDPSQGEDGQQPPRPQDGQPDGESPPEDQQDGEGQSDMPPPQMTPEQAERLLQAITEDPGEVNRRNAQARGRRPRKDW